MSLVEVTVVGGPNDGERWNVKGRADGTPPTWWRVSTQPVEGEVYAVPIMWDGRRWIADWDKGAVW